MEISSLQPAQIAILLAVSLFFAVAGYSFGRDGGRTQPYLWLVLIFAVTVSTYTYFAYHWLWVAASLGCFGLANAIGSLITRSKQDAARPTRR
jgi:hypothetical protein